MKKAFIFLFTVVFNTALLFAQQAKPYYFAHYGVNNGLASYNTAAVVQDERGFIWIGTMNGLQRLDGHRFMNFKHIPGDRNSLPDNNVEQIYFDRSNNLWLVLNDGSIGKFDTKRFVFNKAKVILSNQNNLQALRKLSEDSEGNMLYTFFNTELLTYNKKTNEFSAANNLFPLPLNWKPVAVTQDPRTKKYWIGTDSGLAVYNRSTKNLSYRNHNVDKEPLLEKWRNVRGVGCYKTDSKGRLWFLSWPVNIGGSRLFCYDLKLNEPVLDSYDLVTVAKQYIEPDFFLEQKDGSIWISGLRVWVKFSEETRSFVSVYDDYTTQERMSYERLNIFEDKEQNLWLATNNNGVYVYNPSRQLFTSFKHHNRISGQKGSGYLVNFIQDDDSTVLVAVWGDGLYRYNLEFKNIPLAINGIPEDNGYSVWGMCRSRFSNNIWLTGQSGFIFIYDVKARTAKRYDPGIFEAKTIRQVVEDNRGVIWLGTQSRGLFKWDPAKATNRFEDGFSRFNSVPNVRIKKMIVDKKGFLWICTNKEGVYQIDPASERIVQQLNTKSSAEKKLLTNDASTIFQYNDSIMLIGTGGLNLYNTNSNTIDHVSSADGLPADAVVTIEKDRQGYLWLGLMNGLCRMNLAKKTFSFYDRSDGIANDNFQVSASYVLPDGRMLFGSSDDFVVFDPYDVKASTKPPDVSITEFKLLNKYLLVDSLSKLDKISLSSEQNSITIGFAGLSYFNKSKLIYYYMMEGIDEEWKKANELNQAIYNYLPAGRYLFKVRAENADGISSASTTNMVIRVYPPFWKSWWFITLLVGALSLLLYWVDRLQRKKKEDFHKIRNDVAGNIHEEINLALNNINILSEMAKIKADADPVKSKEFIELIHNRSHNMIIAMDDMLWSLDPQNDSMQKTVERMREYIDALQNRHEVTIELIVEKKVSTLELNMKFRYEALLLFKEALKALVMAGTRKCYINITLEKNSLLFTIQFDNAHCDLQAINNLLQRRDLEKHVRSIKAILDVQVHKTNSLFILQLPVNKPLN